MKIYNHKNVIISSLSHNATQAVLICHGGYTPERNYFMKGSGVVLTPKNLTIHFNTKEDDVSIGPKVLHFLKGYAYTAQDTCKGGGYIKNYSLTSDYKYFDLPPTPTIDIITISPKGKAHISDVFEAFQIHRRNYTVLYNFACRINKLTYTSSIQHNI